MSAHPQSPVPPEQARKNRRLLLILLASFVVPFLVGDLAYRLGWYEGGKTNHGRLINPPVAFAAMGARDDAGHALDAGFADRHWWLLYVLPAECEAACRNRLFQMRQMPLALGKEGDRLRLALVVTAPLAPATEAMLRKEFPGFARVQGEPARIDAAFGSATPAASRAGELYVMDPMGWIMLAYAPEADAKRALAQGDDVFKDLVKLLKASRIG